MSDDFSYCENVPDYDATKETKGNHFVLNFKLLYMNVQTWKKCRSFNLSAWFILK